MVIAFLLILGLCFGSFVNALVWRVYEKQNKKSKYAKKELSVITGRSMCVHCGHTLSAKDLIPVISWLSLQGRCRYCRKPIPDTPFTELLTPALFILSYTFWPHSWGTRGLMLFALWLTLLVGFVALCVYDYRWQILPDKIVATTGVIALLHVIVEVASGAGMQRVIGAIWGIVFGAGIFWLIFRVSDGRLIGGGDVKLGIVYGILLGGPIKSLLCIFIASLLGTLFALPAALAGKASRTTKIPFGPFLIAATVIVYLFGNDIVTWYRTLAGI